MRYKLETIETAFAEARETFAQSGWKPLRVEMNARTRYNISRTLAECSPCYPIPTELAISVFGVPIEVSEMCGIHQLHFFATPPGVPPISLLKNIDDREIFRHLDVEELIKHSEAKLFLAGTDLV